MMVTVSNFFSKCCPSSGGIAAVTPINAVTNVAASQNPTSSGPNQTTFRIGYHLSGDFDDNSRYDITLFPNDLNPTAQVIKFDETNVREVQLKSFPQAWSLQNVAKVFFTGNLIVAKKSLTNGQRIEVLYGVHNEISSLKVDLRIEGIFNNIPYHLDLNTVDITMNKATIQDQPNNQYNEIDLDITNLRNLTPLDLQNQLSNLKANLQIQVTQQPSNKMSVSLGQVSNTISAQVVSTEPHDTLLSIHDVRGLCRLLKTGSPDAAKIAEEMVNLFTDRLFPSEAALYEIGELLERATPHDGFRILNSLVRHLDKNALQDEVILKLLSKILTRFQQIHFQRIWEAARHNIETQSFAYLDGVNSPNLIRILEILTEELNSTHLQNDQVSTIAEQLKAVIALLNMMTIQQIKHVKDDLHKKTYNAINQFKNHTELSIAYLAHYGTQCFRLIPNNQTNLQSFYHRTFLFIKGLAKADISLIEPWHVVSIIEGIPDIQEAFTFQDKQKQWFTQLLGVRSTIFGETPEYFFAFVEGIRNRFQEVIQHVGLNDTFFVVGFADLLWSVLHTPQVGTPQQDLKIKGLVIDLYRQIHDNNEGEKEKNRYPFIINATYKQQLRQLIKQRLQSCTTHPLKPISEAAQNTLTSWNLSVPVTVERFDPSYHATQLFDSAVKKHNPILLTLQSIQGALCNFDKQLSTARPYFIPLDAKPLLSAQPKSLDIHLDIFLKSKNSVLAIGGPGGAGKSLGMKVFASRLLENYTEESIIPIYVYLPELVNPKNDVITEALQRHGIGISDLTKRNDFLKRKTVWIFDAYDELDLEKINPLNANLYVTNNLHLLGPNAKVIFAYKTGSGVIPSDVFKPKGEGLQELMIAPFTHDKIFEYLDNFYEIRQQTLPIDRPMPLLWTKDEYRENFTQLQNTNFWDILTNPFRLRINAEMFPIIVEARRKENVNFTPGDLFRGDEKNVIEHKMFSYFASIRDLRSAQKLKGLFTIDPVKFLNYQADVAHEMALHNVMVIPQNMEGAVRRKFGKLFVGMDTITNVAYRVFAKECLEEGIVDHQKVWSFLHDDYREFFEVMHLIMRTEDERKKMINETITQEKFDALFAYD